MITVMLMSVGLIAVLCVVAYTLAVYALPFMLGLSAAQFAYQTGSGFIGAGLVGLVAAGAAFGVLALLFDTLRSPILRLIVALTPQPQPFLPSFLAIASATQQTPALVGAGSAQQPALPSTEKVVVQTPVSGRTR